MSEARPLIAVLVNGSGSAPNATRARKLIEPLTDRYRVHILYRGPSKIGTFRRFLLTVRALRPDLVYCLDLGYGPAGAALAARALWGTRFILDVGDPVSELLRNTGRPPWERHLARLMETIGPTVAEHTIAAGYGLARWYESRGFKRVTHIPYGVDIQQFRPSDQTALRDRLGIGKNLVFGVAGTLAWNEAAQTCYGKEVIEAVRLIAEEPVKGLVVGTGSGLERMKAMVAQYGLSEKIVFTGQVPHDAMPDYINAMDVCVSTQSNDAVGQLRTTSAKLAEYLACGRYVVATDTGEEIRRLIGPVGHVVTLSGTWDEDYPARLGQHLRGIVADPSILSKAQGARRIAEAEFDYAILRRRLVDVLDAVLARKG